MLTGRAAALRQALPPALVVRTRTVRRALMARTDAWATEGFGVGRCRGVRIRPLVRADGPTWQAAMRANHERMTPWWSLGEEDLDRATDDLAFESHFEEWERRRRLSAGVCLAFVGPQGLVGELQVWHLHPGGRTCEIGLWMSPDQSREVVRGCVGCMGHVFDRMFGVMGIGRVDAPVAVANPLPRPFLQLGGFELDATVPRWRELHGELADYDLFGLTPERWHRARPNPWRLMGPWESGDS